jgi:ABC-type branched-subunit amino acid transport system permease subunit
VGREARGARGARGVRALSVASRGDACRRPGGWLARLRRIRRALPARDERGNLFRVRLDTLIYALLALGLNVVVGFAGLLDLGYVAFFGFGAYASTRSSRRQFGIHWQDELAIPIVVDRAALLGSCSALPSRRLLGDYLAIVTLFFLQAFVVFVNNATGSTFSVRRGTST